jgi:two-component system, chemotaxis family, sensor kinase Cph1
LTSGHVLDGLPEAAFVLDPTEGRFVAANAAGCAMLGYSRAELFETPISRIHPGELPMLEDFVGRVLRDGHGTTISLACRTRTGTYLPTEMALHAFEQDDSVYILALIHDRSEHRGGERSLRSRSAGPGTLGTWSPRD